MKIHQAEIGWQLEMFLENCLNNEDMELAMKAIADNNNLFVNVENDESRIIKLNEGSLKFYLTNLSCIRLFEHCVPTMITLIIINDTNRMNPPNFDYE